MNEFEVRLGDLEKSPEMLIFALRYYTFSNKVKQIFSTPDREKGRVDQSPCRFSRHGLERFYYFFIII